MSPQQLVEGSAQLSREGQGVLRGPRRPAAPAVQGLGLGARGQGKATSGGSLGGERGGEGDEPKAGLAEGLTGSSTTLA